MTIYDFFFFYLPFRSCKHIVRYQRFFTSHFSTGADTDEAYNKIKTFLMHEITITFGTRNNNIVGLIRSRPPGLYNKGTCLFLR